MLRKIGTARWFGPRVFGLLVAGLILVAANAAWAANRIEGSVTYSYNSRRGKAAYAQVEVVNSSTGRVVDWQTAGYWGEYTAWAPTAGKYYVRAYYNHAGRTLTGTSNGINFRASAGGVARGMNILVR